MKKIYQLGILGLGEGRSVISAALSSPHWEIGNICDLNESLCRSVAKNLVSQITPHVTKICFVIHKLMSLESIHQISFILFTSAWLWKQEKMSSVPNHS